MKFFTFKSMVTAMLLFISIISFGQKDFQGKAYYESKTTVDMSNFGGSNMPEERRTEIVNRMKSLLEKSFVLTFNQTESTYKEVKSEEGQDEDRRGRRFAQMLNYTGGDMYKNVRKLEVLQEQEFFGKQFLIKDSLPKLDWKLGTETKIVGDYTCYKATAETTTTAFDFSNFGKRPDENESKVDRETRRKRELEPKPRDIVITAWFTLEIPVNQGPGKYWGLPGLILELNSENTTIYCSKIVLNTSEKDELKVPSEGKEISQAKFNAVVKKKMAELDARRQQRGNRGPGGGGRR
ncbi:GLPGLI family protein [Algibacter pacificus]|uniref:GLPGLI family protein n=1 Tax=Algibacter pacificus TaxID=2599389 RepID=UPI001FE7582D|nr:GLPGLI family protein [Algibacter pacificus]